MNMGSLRTELDVPMSLGQRAEACQDHGSGDDDDVMMLGSTPKVSPAYMYLSASTNGLCHVHVPRIVLRQAGESYNGYGYILPA